MTSGNTIPFYCEIKEKMIITIFLNDRLKKQSCCRSFFMQNFNNILIVYLVHLRG